MRQSTPLLAAALVVLATLAAPALPAAGADDQTSSLSGREARRLQKGAAEAVSSGRLAEASELYEELLAGLPAGDDRRAAALHYGAMTYLLLDETPEPAHRRRAAALLEELLTAFPGYERSLEDAVVLRLVSGTADLEAELAEYRGSLAAESAELEREQQRLTEEREAVAEQLATAEAETRVLRSRVSQLEAQLAEVQAELAKKEEALERVKATVVGG